MWGLLTSLKITLSKTIMMIEFFWTHRLSKIILSKVKKKMFKKVIDHLVKTTYGVFYQWHPIPQGL
jgi:hypothetical protein